MTLTTVSDPRRLAKTSMRPRYGLSLKRTGEFASSVDAKVTGALECSGAPAVAKATTSRLGALARAVNRTRLRLTELAGLVPALFAIDAGAGCSAFPPEVPFPDGSFSSVVGA